MEKSKEALKRARKGRSYSTGGRRKEKEKVQEGQAHLKDPGESRSQPRRGGSNETGSQVHLPRRLRGYTLQEEVPAAGPKQDSSAGAGHAPNREPGFEGVQEGQEGIPGVQEPIRQGIRCNLIFHSRRGAQG